MYGTIEELLSVQHPEGLDAVAQRAARVLKDVKTLAREALLNDMQETHEDILVLHFTAWLPLLKAHSIRGYDFVRTIQESQPTDVDPDTDVLELLPVVLSLPTEEDALSIVAMCEQSNAAYRELIPAVVLN